MKTCIMYDKNSYNYDDDDDNEDDDILRLLLRLLLDIGSTEEIYMLMFIVATIYSSSKIEN